MSVLLDNFLKKARDIHGNKYDYSQVVYVNCKQKVKIICPIHGEFEQTPDKHINCKCGCPECSGNVRYTRETFISKARAVHGDKYDYSRVGQVNNEHNKVIIVCPVHGEFEQTVGLHARGGNCPKCVGNYSPTTDEFVEKAVSIHGNKYDYSNVHYINKTTLVEIICPIHGVFMQSPEVHLMGSGCPLCGNISTGLHRDGKAAYEKARLTFLDKYGVDNPMKVDAIRNHHKDVVSSDEVNDKRIATKRKNHSFNTSLPEYRLGVLLEGIFGSDDVFHNYRSDKYPFMCDFYIASRDLYIELNAHWTHGGHWFTESDKETISVWAKKYGEVYGNTFSVRDVEKRKIASENCLNYVVFWKADLSDAKKWIELGCPDGQDWKHEYSWLPIVVDS